MRVLIDEDTAVQLLQAAPIAKTSRPDLEKLP